MADQHGIIAGAVKFALGLVYQFMATEQCSVSNSEGRVAFGDLWRDQTDTV